MRALLFGMSHITIASTSALLSRSGFDVDVISTDAKIAYCRSCSSCIIVENSDELIESLKNILSTNTYHLYIPTEDRVLELIIQSPLPEELKNKLLPVISSQYAAHLYSKINLSYMLKKASVETPDFFVVHNKEELLNLDKRMQRPYFLKKDSSGGGAGVYLIDAATNLLSLSARMRFPILLQKKIDGDLLDLSGFFFNGELIYFNCSQMILCRPNQFGLSILRRYYKSPYIGSGYYHDLLTLGRALGAHGFSNISAIRSHKDKKLYFIEADLRPNAWIEHGLFIGEDPADAISEYFYNGKTISSFSSTAPKYHLDINHCEEIPLYSRMTPEEIKSNAFNCNDYKIDYFDH